MTRVDRPTKDETRIPRVSPAGRPPREAKSRTS
jgi:hypothetical protein